MQKAKIKNESKYRQVDEKEEKLNFMHDKSSTCSADNQCEKYRQRATEKMCNGSRTTIFFIQQMTQSVFFSFDIDPRWNENDGSFQ